MSVRTYTLAYVALMAMLLLTYASTLVPLGAFKPVANIGIGAVKAAIILCVFMHLAKAEPLTRLAGALAYLWLILMFVLGFSDYLTR
jgi:cytochrome c oxidase subunit 4